MSIDVLQERIRKLQNPTMVAISPSVLDLPAAIKQTCTAEYGSTLRAAAEGYRQFSMGILDTLEGIVPAVSVETGSFYALGAEGVAAMQDVLRGAAERGYYVLLDLMRGDIGPTAQTMADACFGAVQVGDQSFTPYPCDGALLSGYLGSDSVMPFAQYCRKGKNVFVVARSSNKSAREVQDLLSGDRIVYQVMADLVMRWSAGLFTRSGYSEMGIAVGATNPTVLQALRRKYDKLFFLVPGYGTQGASAHDASLAFDAAGYGACVIVGRSILNAHLRTPQAGEDYRTSAKQAAIAMREQLLRYVKVF